MENNDLHKHFFFRILIKYSIQQFRKLNRNIVHIYFLKIFKIFTLEIAYIVGYLS